MESNPVPAVCILIYVSLSVVGLLTLPWTMSAEMFPLDIRGQSQGLVVSLAHIVMFFSLKIYPFLKDILGSEHATMWLFAAVSLSSVIFVFIFLPETHKRTLLEIEHHFMHSSVFVFSVKKRHEAKNEGYINKGQETM